MKYKECVDGPDHCWHINYCCLCHGQRADLALAKAINGRDFLILPCDAPRKAAKVPRIDAKSNGGTAGRPKLPVV